MGIFCESKNFQQFAVFRKNYLFPGEQHEEQENVFSDLVVKMKKGFEIKSVHFRQKVDSHNLSGQFHFILITGFFSVGLLHRSSSHKARIEIGCSRTTEIEFRKSES